MNDKPGQRQYKFSLSVRDKHNRQVKKIVDGLLSKGRGALSQSIRDGLRLLNDLRRGNTKVLLEMFPDIIDKLCPAPTPPTKDDKVDELKQMIVNLEKRLEGQKTVYISANTDIPDTRESGLPAMMPAMKQAGQGIGTLANRKIDISMPVFDDEDDQDTLVIKEAANKPTIFGNLMASINSASDKSDREYADQLAAGNIDPRSGRRINETQVGMD